MVISSTAPGIPKVIKIIVTTGVKGQHISIINRRTGDRIYSVLGDTAKHVVDLQNFEPNNYTAGDVIDFIVSGTVLGSSSLTTVGDAPQTVTVAASTTASTAARGI